MLVENPIRCSISLQCIFNYRKEYYDASDYLTRLTVTLTFSTHFFPQSSGRLFISLWHLREKLTCFIELVQGSITHYGLTAFYCTFSFAAGFCLQCTNTGGIPPHTSLLVTHLYCDLQLYRQYSHKTYTKLLLLFSISCPSIKCILLYRPDAPSRFAVQTSGLLFCYLLLRNGWHSTSLSYV